MRIQDGQNAIILPEAVEPYTVIAMAYSGGVQEHADPGYWMMMWRIEFADMMKMDTPTRENKGIPDKYAISPDKKVIIIHPVNNRQRDVSIRYCPAMKEI